MNRQNINKYLQERENINKLYNAPRYRRLKFAALAVIAVALILLLVLAFWVDDIPPKVQLIMRGCAGLCAIIFVVLFGVLAYRVNKHYINNRW